MCRGIEHGGRRCPNDNSEARRARRANATAKKEYASKSESLKPSKVLITQEENPSHNSPPTMDSVKAKLDELDALKEEQAAIREKNEKGFYIKEVEGGIIGRDELEKSLITQMESKLREVGNEIRMLAISRTGFTDEKMVNIVEDSQRVFLKAHDDAEAELKAYDAFLAEKYADPRIENNEDYKTGQDMILYAKVMEDNKHHADVQKDWNKFVELQGKKYEAHLAISKALSKTPEAVTEMQKANAEEFRKIISEIRPLGGNIKVSDTSAKKETKVMEEIASTYPTAWIEASNNSNELRVKKTAGRAHYSHQREQKSFIVAPQLSIHVQPEGWEPDPLSAHKGSGWFKINSEKDEYGDNYYIDPKSGIKYSVGLSEGETAWVAPRHEYFNVWSHNTKSDGSPSGRGWEKCEIKSTKYIDGENVEVIEKTWRRPVTRRIQTQSVPMAELTVDNEASAFGSNGYATAIHEFAHRIETTGPEFINTMQTEFLKRRTTDSSGVREKKQAIYGWSKRETGRFDNFADKYMGKEYMGTKNHEILSCGAEAVFAGKFGGLSGVGKYTADPDMKNFILGLWASA
jgi:hypothetical protein